MHRQFFFIHQSHYENNQSFQIKSLHFFKITSSNVIEKSSNNNFHFKISFSLSSTDHRIKIIPSWNINFFFTYHIYGLFLHALYIYIYIYIYIYQQVFWYFLSFIVSYHRRKVYYIFFIIYLFITKFLFILLLSTSIHIVHHLLQLE